MMRSLLFLVAALFLVASCSGGDSEGITTPTPDTPASPKPSPSATVVGMWTEGAPMPTARSEVTSAVLDGKIYVIGGFEASGSNSSAVEAYEPATDSWVKTAPLPVTLDHAMAATVDGKLYVVGGYRVFGSEISSSTYEYNPASDLWTERAPMPLERAAGAAVAADGAVYLLGGVGPQPTVGIAYDPRADAWRELPPMEVPREHLTAGVVGTAIYVIGGRWEGVNVGTVDVYSVTPGDCCWRTLESMPTARGGLASGVILERIHVVGGEDLQANSTFAEHEVYDLVSNRPDAPFWTAAPPLPTARHGLTAQVVGGRLYVIGGGPEVRLSTSPLVEVFTPGE